MANAAKAIKGMTRAVFKGVRAPEVGETYHVLCENFPLRNIESKSQNDHALKVVERLMDFLNVDVPNPAVAKDVESYLSVLTDLCEKFERETYASFSKQEPREFLAFLMKAHLLKQSDLAKDLGGQSVVSGILNGKRDLNVSQIRSLSKRFKVSPALFF